MPIVAYLYSPNRRPLGLLVSGVVQTDYTTGKQFMRESYSATKIPVRDIIQWAAVHEAVTLPPAPF